MEMFDVETIKTVGFPIAITLIMVFGAWKLINYIIKSLMTQIKEITKVLERISDSLNKQTNTLDAMEARIENLERQEDRRQTERRSKPRVNVK